MGIMKISTSFPHGMDAPGSVPKIETRRHRTIASEELAQSPYSVIGLDYIEQTLSALQAKRSN